MIPSQRDPKWSSKRLGTSPYTMGSSGCRVVSDCICLNYLGIQVDPGTLCDQYNAIGAFDADGNVASWRLHELYPQISPKVESNQTNIKGHKGIDINQALTAIKILVDSGKPVIVQLDLSPHNGVNEGDHFGVFKPYGWNNNDPILDDPWWGLETTLASSHPATANDQAFNGYGRPKDAIYGYRVISLVNSSQPDMPTPHINLPDNCLSQLVEGHGGFGMYDATKDILYVDDTANIIASWLVRTKGKELDPRTTLTLKQWNQFNRYNLKNELLK